MSAFIPNASSTYLSVPYTGAAAQDLTFMCWGYLSTTNPVAYRVFIGGVPNCYMATHTDGLTFDCGEEPGQDQLGSVLTAGVWYHLTMTMANNGSASSHNIKGYINGVGNIQGTGTETFSTYTSLDIGGQTNGTFPLSGNVRDVRIWTRALSAQEVADEFRSGVPIHKAGLLIWSPLDDNLFVDKSGSGHLWTTSGTITLQSGPLKPWVGRETSYFR
jgi:hypothetical protein